MRGRDRDSAPRHHAPLMLGTPSNSAPEGHRAAMARARNLFLRMAGKGTSLAVATTRFFLAIVPLALLLAVFASRQLPDRPVPA